MHDRNILATTLSKTSVTSQWNAILQWDEPLRRQLPVEPTPGCWVLQLTVQNGSWHWPTGAAVPVVLGLILALVVGNQMLILCWKHVTIATILQQYISPYNAKPLPQYFLLIFILFAIYLFTYVLIWLHQCINRNKQELNLLTALLMCVHVSVCVFF